jgi:hypothetical protein
MGRLSRPAAIVGVTGLLIAGGGGYAIASSGSHMIVVCVKHSDGTLYRARKCADHDHKLSWNRQGPRGRQGAQGSQGVQGAQGVQGVPGSAGISAAYLTHGADAQTLTANNHDQSVVSMNVPSGTYDVQFTLEATASAQSYVACSISGGSVEEGGGLAQFAPSGPGNYSTDIHVDDVAQGVTTITGSCRNLESSATVYGVTLIATPIVDLHVQ